MLEGLKENGKTAVHFNSVSEDSDQEKNTNYIKTRIIQEQPDVALINYEDWPYSRRNGLAQYNAFTGNARSEVVLMRSFPNLMASQIQRRNTIERLGMNFIIQDKTLETVRDLWVEFSRDILGSDNHAFTTVLYDKWVANKSYRDDIAKMLGFKNHDIGIDFVPDFGGGSSFDGFSHQGKGTEMRTLDRWRYFVQDKEAMAAYEALITPEVSELSIQLFGVDPAAIFKV